MCDVSESECRGDFLPRRTFQYTVYCVYGTFLVMSSWLDIKTIEHDIKHRKFQDLVLGHVVYSIHASQAIPTLQPVPNDWEVGGGGREGDQ